MNEEIKRDAPPIAEEPTTSQDAGTTADEQAHNGSKGRTWTEEIEVAGNELVEIVKKLLKEGNVRRLIISKPNGDVLMEIPLTAGVAVGGVMTIFAPILVALGAMAALLEIVKVRIVRVEQPGSDVEPKDE